MLLRECSGRFPQIRSLNTLALFIGSESRGVPRNQSSRGALQRDGQGGLDASLAEMTVRNRT